MPHRPSHQKTAFLKRFAEQAAIISLNGVNWLVFTIKSASCFLWGARRIFVLLSSCHTIPYFSRFPTIYLIFKLPLPDAYPGSAWESSELWCSV
jgi:hypothetical protein